MKLELYHRWGCPYSAKVRDFIERYDLQNEVRMVEVDETDYAIETLFKVNGKGQVPCLLIDGKPMLESNDIIRFLTENFLGTPPEINY